jgi:hypothetical protein
MRIDGKETIQLNVSERAIPDPGGPQPAAFWGASTDDSKVFFSTAELLTEDAVNGGSGKNIYQYDLNAPVGKRLTLISTDDEPAEEEGELPDRGYAVVGMSSDGDYVYFIGKNRLVAGQPSMVVKGYRKYELYVWHQGELRNVAEHTLDADVAHGFAWGESGVAGRDMFRVTADGKTVMYVEYDSSTAHRLGYEVTSSRCSSESGTCLEAYVYRYDTNQLSCASCDQTGETPHSNASIDTHDGLIRLAHPAPYLNHPLTSDGRFVFFDTEDALVPQDTNNRRDVYEYDVATGQQHLISSGACGCDSDFLEASPDGSNVFFVTRDPLVHADVDNAMDLYDARVDGGIVAQNQQAVAPCEGDDCQAPAVSAPLFSVPASASFSGAGNAAEESKAPTVKAKHKVKAKKKAKRKRKRVVKRGKKHGKNATKSAKRVSRRAGR